MLELEFSELQVLIDLGLTLKQARVYRALARSGSLRVSTISKISKVARPDVYVILPKLQELGLVEEIIETPFKYKATPMNESLTLLLDRRREQYEKLRAETRLLLDTLKIESKKTTNQLKGSEFVLIPKGRHVIERIGTAIAQAQISMRFLLSWKRFSRGMVSTFAENMETAWAKNVDQRLIIENPLKSETAAELIQLCEEKPSCQIKFIRNCPNIVLGIYDRKEVFLIVNPKTDLPDSPALWSNNTSFVTLAENYFDNLWLTATKTPKMQK